MEEDKGVWGWGWVLGKEYGCVGREEIESEMGRG